MLYKYFFILAVVRECCIVIAKISIVRQGHMTRWVQRILEKLFDTMRTNVDIIAISAHQAAKSILRCVPDSSKLEILKEIIAASRSKHPQVRVRAYEYIALLIERTRLESNLKKNFFLKAISYHIYSVWVKLMWIIISYSFETMIFELLDVLVNFGEL